MDYYPNELYHHGIKGMKWGVRRYQNADGSLTAAGRLRYGAGQARDSVRKAASSARSYGSNAYNKAKATYNRKVTKADIGKIAATAGVVAVAALAIKHRGAISTGMKFAGKMAQAYGKVTVQNLSSKTTALGRKAANAIKRPKVIRDLKKSGQHFDDLRTARAYREAGKDYEVLRGASRLKNKARVGLNNTIDKASSKASSLRSAAQNQIRTADAATRPTVNRVKTGVNNTISKAKNKVYYSKPVQNARIKKDIKNIRESEKAFDAGRLDRQNVGQYKGDADYMEALRARRRKRL